MTLVAALTGDTLLAAHPLSFRVLAAGSLRDHAAARSEGSRDPAMMASQHLTSVAMRARTLLPRAMDVLDSQDPASPRSAYGDPAVHL
ncbi:MAG: hypothetical protein R3E12_02080 [Candidatus Eisenbacteria bacterium]